MTAALYGFAYSSQALAYLETRSPKERRQIVRKINGLASNPHPAGTRPLRGMRNEEERVYRIRSGDYRVLYVVRELEIVILDIDHRKDVYR